MQKYTLKTDERLIKTIPSSRQLKLQQLEFYAFVHFTVNTFTDREWGDGKEDPAIFNPEKLDAEQWVKAVKSAGMRGLILTCKHHDGFCLWPSKYTDHSVASSPYKGGNGDVVREVSDACAKYGIAFGVYLSPWDRNNAAYGKGKEYDDYFVNQLTELLTGYGDIFSVWFDGACGEGENGKVQYYDWERYYEVIRTLRPDACINVCGPDVRWCGNEAGYTRKSEWSVVPLRTRDTEKISAESQQSDDEAFRARKISAHDEDLGSRRALENETELVWYPAEVNTSIRPGWFYHDYEDDKVKSLDELIRVYNNSVGGNATFLLNVPPTRDGLFHENDVKRLKELGEYIENAFKTNVLDAAALYCCSCLKGCSVENVRTDDYETYYRTEDGITEAIIAASWRSPVDIGCIVLKENILLSQRVESFMVETCLNGQYRVAYNGTVIGYKKIIPLGKVTADGIRIRITNSRVAPTISFLGVYEAR